MILFNAFRERARTPTLYVNTIGGIFRVDANTLKETLCATLPNARGDMETVATVHLIWPTNTWLESAALIRYARHEYERTAGFLRVQ
jgi:hypothetical protein